MEQIFYVGAFLLLCCGAGFFLMRKGHTLKEKSPIEIIEELTPVIVSTLEDIQDLINIEDCVDENEYTGKVADKVSEVLYEEFQKEDDDTIVSLLDKELIKKCLLKLFDIKDEFNIPKLFEDKKLQLSENKECVYEEEVETTDISKEL